MARKAGKNAKPKDWSKLLQAASRQSATVRLSSREGSPTPPEKIFLADDKYLRMRLVSFYHPLIRKGWTRQQPVVYANANWRRPSHGELPQARIITPSTIEHPDAQKGGAFAFQGQVLFGPVRYNGALDISLGMLVRKSNTGARRAIDLAAKGLKVVSQTGMLVIDPAADILLEITKWLLPDGDSDFLVGASRDLPGERDHIETGTWAILAPSEKARDVWLDASDNRLKDASGAAITTPYLVYSLDAISNNPDRAYLPDIAQARERLRTGLSNGEELGPDYLERLFKLYAFTVRMSEELNEADKSDLIGKARQEYGDLINITEDFFGHLGTEFPAVHTPEDAPAPETQASTAAKSVGEAMAQLESGEGEASAEAREQVDARIDSALTELAAAAINDPSGQRAVVEQTAAMLRSQRLWPQISWLENELRQSAVEYPRLAYFAALAAVDSGDLETGEAMAARALMLAREAGDTYNESEALALQGRVWKTRAVHAADPKSATTKNAFNRAITYYRQGDIALQLSNPGDPFQKVNILALITAAKRAGHNVGKGIPSQKWAKAILRNAASAQKNSAPGPWDYANAGDASLFLGKRDEAAVWYGRYIEAERDDPFAMNATRRQLVEVWGIDPAGDDPLADQLRRMAAYTIASGESFTLTMDEIKAISAANLDEIGDLEAHFGGPTSMSAKHVQRVVELGAHIGQVQRPNGSHVGTGFLVPGGDLYAGWAGETVMLTNDHVIREEKLGRISVHPNEAVVFFKQVNEGQPCQVKEMLWHSDWKTGHDCAIVRLHSLPDIKVAPFEIAPGLPPRWRGEIESAARQDDRDSPRIFILGHPSGRDLEITFYNNFLIDHEHTKTAAPATAKPTRIHYRAPTEPGGSGSPILNERTLKLIGIHHSGKAKAPLNGHTVAPGTTYRANEGLWIQAIRKQILADLGPASSAPPPSGEAEAPEPERPVASDPAPASIAEPEPEPTPEPIPEPVEAETRPVEVEPAPAPPPEPKPVFTPPGIIPDAGQAGTAALVGAVAGAVGAIAGAIASAHEDSHIEGMDPETIDPDDLESAYGDNIDTRNETAEHGFGAPEAQLEASSAWLNLSDKPDASWATLDQHPDTRHIAHIQCEGDAEVPFELSDAVIRKALAFASVPIDPRWGRKVLVGIRAALPQEPAETSAPPIFTASTSLVQTLPDHRAYKCTMGVWDTGDKSLWLTPASTVPARGYMWDQAQVGRTRNYCNLVSPGLYTYRVGTHANGSRTRQPGAFRQASKLCVLRSYSSDFEFNIADDWDVATDASGPRIWDNIHAGLGATQKWGAQHYSAGCQVLPGTVRTRDTTPTPTEAWANFREAAGLRRVPHTVKLSGAANPDDNPRVVGTTEDGNAYVYILLTARELRIAAENMAADDNDPRFAKLRRGSKGEGVKALQTALGISVDGDFGYLTQRALIEAQLAQNGQADGVVTAANAASLGMSVTGPAPTETPFDAHEDIHQSDAPDIPALSAELAGEPEDVA